MTALPEFRTHGYDQKFFPLTDKNATLPAHTLHYVALIDSIIGGLEGRKVLDMGCGRGELVNALRERGARAFGVEIDPRFVESGKLVCERYPDEYPALSVLNPDGSSIFPDEYFDLIISDQVLEHVAQLDSFAAETARLLRPGGITLHEFPAQRVIMEPHYGIPFAHWLPKNALRWQWINLMLRMGRAKQFFPQLTINDRTSVIFKYSVEETFYRRPSEIANAFARYGVFSNGLDASKLYLKHRIGHSSSAAAWIMRTFRNSIFSGTKSALR